jgi:SAM-dependent methyltransferase
MSQEYSYEGSELELFSRALNWKSYWGSLVRPYVGSTVLDVGAGIGATAQLLCGSSQLKWIALEPDPKLAEEIARRQRAGTVPATCAIKVGTVSDLSNEEKFDSILYIDVLEHIEDDHGEFCRSAEHLRPGGHLIVLAPAHQFLFSPFDKSVGHCRRYDKRSMGALEGSDLDRVRIDYLDSVGMLASLANRLLLKSGMPTNSQIALWDKMMVRPSRFLDGFFGHVLGKSILGVWRKRAM